MTQQAGYRPRRPGERAEAQERTIADRAARGPHPQRQARPHIEGMCECCNEYPAKGGRGQWRNFCPSCEKSGKEMIARDREFERAAQKAKAARIAANEREWAQWREERRAARLACEEAEREDREERRLAALAEKRWGFLREL